MSLDKFGRYKKESPQKFKRLEDELRVIKSNYEELWLQVVLMQEDFKKMAQKDDKYKSELQQVGSTVEI